MAVVIAGSVAHAMIRNGGDSLRPLCGRVTMHRDAKPIVYATPTCRRCDKLIAAATPAVEPPVRAVETPELDRRAAIMPQAETLTEFVDWLEPEGLRICSLNKRRACTGVWDPQASTRGVSYDCDDGTLRLNPYDTLRRFDIDRTGETCPKCDGAGWVERGPGEYEPISEGWERLFARFFELDLDKIEAERRALLASLRT